MAELEIVVEEAAAEQVIAISFERLQGRDRAGARVTPRFEVICSAQERRPIARAEAAGVR